MVRRPREEGPLAGKFTLLTPFPKRVFVSDVQVWSYVCPLAGMWTWHTSFRDWWFVSDDLVYSDVSPSPRTGLPVEVV